jgi:NAD(P)-dependent dehydrogenase (short-subunit alcohol dehydrogenase family)
MTTLQNKTALVTGASRGIGRAIALALAQAGAHVLVHYGRSAQEADSVVAAIQTKGGRADAKVHLPARHPSSALCGGASRRCGIRRCAKLTSV